VQADWGRPDGREQGVVLAVSWYFPLLMVFGVMAKIQAIPVRHEPVMGACAAKRQRCHVTDTSFLKVK